MVTGRPLLLTAEDEAVTVTGCRRLAARARVGQAVSLDALPLVGRQLAVAAVALARTSAHGPWINRQWGDAACELSVRTKDPEASDNQVATRSGNGRHAATQSDSAILRPAVT